MLFVQGEYLVLQICDFFFQLIFDIFPFLALLLKIFIDSLPSSFVFVSLGAKFFGGFFGFDESLINLRVQILRGHELRHQGLVFLDAALVVLLETRAVVFSLLDVLHEL